MFGITSGLLIGTAVFLKTSKLLKSIKHIAYCAAYDQPVQPSLTQLRRYTEGIKKVYSWKKSANAKSA